MSPSRLERKKKTIVKTATALGSDCPGLGTLPNIRMKLT